MTKFCPFCGTAIAPPDSKFCRSCGKPLADSVSESEPIPEAAGCPWENMREQGFVKALIDTMAAVLFKPTSFFRSLPPRDHTKSALLFGVLLGSAGYIASALWQMTTLDKAWVPDAFSSWVQSAQDAVGLSAFFAPVIALMAVVVQAAILHVFLAIVGGNKNGFVATLRAISYGMSAQVFALVPVLGGGVSFVWGTVLTIIGLREIHRISTVRAIAALLVPLIVVFFLAILVAVLAIALLPEFFKDIGKEILPLAV